MKKVLFPFFLAIFGGFPLVMAGYALFMVYGATSLTLRAEHSEGVVVGFERELGFPGKYHYTTNHPVVEYRTASGETIRFRALADRKRGNISKGQRVAVLYDPRAPEAASIDSFEQLWLIPLLFSSMALPVGGFVFWLWIRGLRRWRLHAWLRRNGQWIQAELVGFEQVASKQNGNRFWHVVARWQEPKGGRSHVFKSERCESDPRLFGDPEAIAVAIDPADPGRYMMNLSFLPEFQD
jgi:hypothetical protein